MPLLQSHEDQLPRISQLYVRHPGMTRALSAAYEEAAAVCLSGPDAPPTTFDILTPKRRILRDLEWDEPNERQRRAWNNEIDRIEAAAYGLSLSAIEAELGLLAVARARTLTGADYYLAAGTPIDLETAYRLEVSGTSQLLLSRINERLKAKVLQVARTAEPSLACVVALARREVLIVET